MGQEAECTVRFGANVSKGTALLEHDVLRFRGDVPLSIPFNEMTSIVARQGNLKVTFARGVATFALGPRAEQWADRIRFPKSLMDKIGVKADSRVAVLGVQDDVFWQQLRGRAADISTGRPRAGSDIIFLLAEKTADLKRLKSLQNRIKRNGAIWVVSPKGRGDVKERDVLAAGKVADLVDVKVVAFSATHTAHKFVIPRACR